MAFILVVGRVSGCTNAQHTVWLQALWLSNMSSVLLFWPYLKASFSTPIKQVLGATMEFKTTLKGANKGGLDLKVFGIPCLIILANIVTFIIGAVTLDAQINAAKGVPTVCTSSSALLWAWLFRHRPRIW